jgi:hypothetical protein
MSISAVWYGEVRSGMLITRGLNSSENNPKSISTCATSAGFGHVHPSLVNDIKG